jgi:transcriptional regulator with GAF, ATPase, and Fis domain
MKTNPRLNAAILRHSTAAQTQVAAVLIATRNNWTKAAHELGISFRQFRYLMSIHGAAIESKMYNLKTANSVTSELPDSDDTLLQ